MNPLAFLTPDGRTVERRCCSNCRYLFAHRNTCPRNTLTTKSHPGDECGGWELDEEQSGQGRMF